jgi:hypothetical protein
VAGLGQGHWVWDAKTNVMDGEGQEAKEGVHQVSRFLEESWEEGHSKGIFNGKEAGPHIGQHPLKILPLNLK